MTQFSIILQGPNAVRDLAINYAKVADATGDVEGYEFFNILREKVEEAQYGLRLKEIEAKEIPHGYFTPFPQFPGYEINRDGDIRYWKEGEYRKEPMTHYQGKLRYQLLDRNRIVIYLTREEALTRYYTETI